MNPAKRVRLLSRTYTPELPDPQMVRSLVYYRTLDDGRYEYVCSHCGSTQIVNELDGATETRVCRA